MHTEFTERLEYCERTLTSLHRRIYALENAKDGKSGEDGRPPVSHRRQASRDHFKYHKDQINNIEATRAEAHKEMNQNAAQRAGEERARLESELRNLEQRRDELKAAKDA